MTLIGLSFMMVHSDILVLVLQLTSFRFDSWCVSFTVSCYNTFLNHAAVSETRRMHRNLRLGIRRASATVGPTKYGVVERTVTKSSEIHATGEFESDPAARRLFNDHCLPSVRRYRDTGNQGEMDRVQSVRRGQCFPHVLLSGSFTHETGAVGRCGRPTPRSRCEHRCSHHGCRVLLLAVAGGDGVAGAREWVFRIEFQSTGCLVGE